MKHYQNHKVTRHENGDIEIEAELTKETLEKSRAKAIREINSRTEIPGFRKGHIPEKVLIERVGEIAILDESARDALPEAAYGILTEEKIEPLGRPEIYITKLSPSEPIVFKIKASVLPEVKLPDYKKIALEENKKPQEKIEVTDEDVALTLKELQKMRAYQNDPKKDPATIKDEELPVIDDAFAKALGDFKDVADLKEKIKENIAHERAHKEKDKKRVAIAEKLVSETKSGVPTVLVDSELSRMHTEFHEGVERMGMKTEDYLKNINKTEEDLMKEWRGDAEKKAKLQLVLYTIAKTEKLAPTKEAVNHEVSHVLEHYKDADPQRAQAYVETVLTNEKVFEFLEKQG